MKNSINFILALLILISGNLFPSKAQTNVSGGIFSNTTWTLANSPYIIVDTVVLFPGYTLTIEPGVTVKFEDNKFLEIRQSRIIALGTVTDSITFTSNSVTPTKGIYSGILLNASLNSDFAYCNFQYADKGINTNINFLTVKHSAFSYNNRGIYNSSTQRALIQECEFRYNTYGLYYVKSSIQNCQIINNDYGIYNCYGTTVKYCIIDSNSVVGINIPNGDSILYNEISYNTIGIKLDGGNTFSLIKGNQIENNNIGIDLFSEMNRIYCNKICSNTIYDLKYENNANSNCIENNYWCTTDSISTAAVIYDGHDNLSLGLLDFIPTDTLNCYITGCNIIVSVSVINATCDTCHDGRASAHVLNSTQPITYTWNTTPLQTTQTAIGLSSGNYIVCVTDANGCTACSPFFVDSTNCTGFTINANSNNTTCSSCSDGIAWVNVTGGNHPFNYTWYTSPIQFTDTASGLLQGTYAVCVSDNSGCISCDTVIVMTGNCSAHFDVYPDTIPHHYYAINRASGTLPLSFSWNWGDGSAIDTIQYPNHTYSAAGFYNVCLSIIDSVGCSNTFCQGFFMMRNNNAMIYLNVRPQIATSILENKNDLKMTLSPNPVVDLLEINVPSNKLNINVKIFDLTGGLQFKTLIDERRKKINVSNLTTGIYIVEVIVDNQICRMRFVKQ